MKRELLQEEDEAKNTSETEIKVGWDGMDGMEWYLGGVRYGAPLRCFKVIPC